MSAASQDEAMLTGATQMFKQYLPSQLHITRAIELFFHEYHNLNSTETPPLFYIITVIQKMEDFDT